MSSLLLFKSPSLTLFAHTHARAHANARAHTLIRLQEMVVQLKGYESVEMPREAQGLYSEMQKKMTEREKRGIMIQKLKA